jgi:GR25 family glycosyltransferase involved in LPS biosynthesis
MDIHLINLDRNARRLAKFLATNSHLRSVRRFPAIDGNTISRKQFCEHDVFRTEMLAYSNGAVGCALSHLALWKEAVTQSSPVTVLEDDAITNMHFETEAAALIESLPPDWDIVLWGWNFDSILLFNFLPGVSPCLGVFSEPELKNNTAHYQQLRLKPQGFRLQRAFGTLAYSISPRGAEKFAKHCLPIREMDVFCPGLNRALPNFGIDVMMNALYPEVNAFVSFPPLAVSENDKSISTVNRPAQDASAKQDARSVAAVP